MKKIKTISLTSLRVEEMFGYLKLVLAETANLPGQGEEEEEPGLPEVQSVRTANPALTNAITAFTDTFNAFDTALKSSSKNPATASVAEADQLRDQSWRAANAYVKAMCSHPTADIAAVAIEAKSLFDKYGDPTSLAQTEESGVLHNLLQDLESLSEEKRTSLALDVWTTDLQTKENAFLAAAAQRTEADAARQVGIVKENRTAAEAAYRSLVDTVNALAIIEGETEYATFIDHTNAMIDRQKAILKARETNNAKKAEEEDKPVVE